MEANRENKAEKATSGAVSLAIYAGYLYFLTHPEKAEEIKWWLQEKWNAFCVHTRNSLDFWESVVTYSNRVDAIRSLPETEFSNDELGELE